MDSPSTTKRTILSDLPQLGAVFVGIAAIGVGAIVGHHLGYPKLGILAGFVMAIALLASMWLLVARLQKVWQPFFPRCRTGRCRLRDYKTIEVYVIQRAFVVRCRCGEAYVRVGGMPNGERRFIILSPDGLLQPYLHAERLFTRWKPDRSPAWDSVDSAATLQKQLQQLGYESKSGPIPQFPVFVLSWDDKSFMEIRDEVGLRYYEQPDLEEGPHHAWDSLGRRFTVYWDRGSRGPMLVFVDDDSIDSFRTAAEEYAKTMASTAGRSLPRRLCDPAELEREAQQMTHRKEAAAYRHLKDSGQGPIEVMRAARAAGGDDVACIRVVRLLFGLSLVEVKKALFESGKPDCTFDEHQAQLAEALQKILEEERDDEC